MTRQTARDELHGILVALVTPMRADGGVDYDTLADFTEYMIGAGVHGLVPLGSTGEFYAMDADERRGVLKRVLDVTNGRVPVIAGTNAAATREVVAYSREAESLGADGVLLAPPFYSLPAEDELFLHYRAVNEAIGIPIMLYNYPGRSGVDMTPAFIERLLRLDRVRYVKESTGDVTRVSALIGACGERLGVFCGGDSVALECLAMGVRGWVGGIANVFPRAHVELYRLAAVEQDLPAARALAYRMLPALSFFEHSGRYTQLVKAGCALKGHPVGDPRAPLRRVSSELTETLEGLIAELD